METYKHLIQVLKYSGLLDSDYLSVGSLIYMLQEAEERQEKEEEERGRLFYKHGGDLE